MNIADALRFLLNPHEADAGWSTRPPEYLTREKAAVDGLEPNALDAVKEETGIFWLNFHEAIAASIAIYLRASGLASIREDYAKLNERCTELERRCGFLMQRDSNLWQSAAVAMGEALRHSEKVGELEKLLDSAIAKP